MNASSTVVTCPGCQAKCRIRLDSGATQFSCPKCQKRLSVRAGGAVAAVPARAAPAKPAPAKPAPAKPAPAKPAAARSGVPPRGSAARPAGAAAIQRQAPATGGWAFNDDDWADVQSGLPPAPQLAPFRRPVAPATAKPDPLAGVLGDSRPAARRDRGDEPNLWLMLAAFCGVYLLVLATGAALLPFAEAVGTGILIALAGVCGLIALVSHLGFLIALFEEEWWHVPLVIFVPFYYLFALVMFWDTLRKPFLGNLVGSIGAAVPMMALSIFQVISGVE